MEENMRQIINEISKGKNIDDNLKKYAYGFSKINNKLSLIHIQMCIRDRGNRCVGCKPVESVRLRYKTYNKLDRISQNKAWVHFEPMPCFV